MVLKGGWNSHNGGEGQGRLLQAEGVAGTSAGLFLSSVPAFIIVSHGSSFPGRGGSFHHLPGVPGSLRAQPLLSVLLPSVLPLSRTK